MTAKVVLSLQAIIRATENIETSSSVSVNGLLFGFDNDGILEISNFFPLAPRSRLAEDADRSRREIEKLRTKVAEVLEYVDGDPQCLGLFRYIGTHASENSNEPPVEPDFLELLHHCLTAIDPATVVVFYNRNKEQLGDYPLSAYQLSDDYLDIHDALTTNKLSYKEFVDKLGEIKPLEEVRVEISNNVDAQAITEFFLPSADQAVAKDSEIQWNIINRRSAILADLVTVLEERADSEKKSK